MVATFSSKFIILIATFIGINTVAADDFVIKKDSLLKIISSSKGKQKLDAYNNLLSLNYPIEEADNALKFADEYIAESNKQNNLEEAMKARTLAVSIMFNYNKKEYQNKRIDEHLDFYYKNNYLSKYYRVKRFLIERMFQAGDRENSLKAAKKMYEQAKINNYPYGIASGNYFIGLYYINLSNTEEGENHMKSALRDVEDSNDQDCKILVIEIYFRLSELYINRINNGEDSNLITKLRPLLTQWYKAIRSLAALSKQMNSATLFNDYYQAQIQFNIIENKLDKAEAYCDSVESIIQDPQAMGTLYRYKSNISEARQDYQKALEYNNEAYDYIMSVSDLPFSMHILKDKIRLLTKTGSSNQVYPLFETYVGRMDSLYSEQSTQQLNELRTKFEVEKLTAEKETNRLRWLSTVGICVFLFIALIVYFIYSKKLKRKNASLYQKIEKLTVVEKVAEQCLLSTPKAKLSKEMQLYQQISECMRKEKLFTNPILNRKKLSDYLNTNETYLAESIHAGSGETFSSYISNLRLQYSLELLHENPEMTLDAIAIDSGHGSYSPFYKAFTKKYSITPSEYRKLAATKIKKQSDQ